MPDPKLGIIATTLRDLLRKEDVAGIVCLASPTHCEYVLQLSTTWNNILTEDDCVRIRSRKEDYPDAAAQKAAAEQTIGTILGLRDTLSKQIEALTRLAEMLGQHWEFSHISKDEPDPPPKFGA